MSSSLTPNAETWTHSLFTTLLLHTQLSVSWVERTTLMAAFISTLSWISADASISGTRDALMLAATTRMFNHVAEHHKRCSTTRLRTEMLSREGSTPISELRYRDLTISGLESQLQGAWRSFGDLLESWLHERSCATTSRSAPTPSGTIDPLRLNTFTPMDFTFQHDAFRRWMNGYVTTCLQVVSTRVASGGPPPGGPTPPLQLERDGFWNVTIFCTTKMARGAKHPLPSYLGGVPPPLVNEC
jgi:hypothetical protein